MEDGGPSVTARRVAAHRLGFSRVPAPYGAPAADEALAADVAAGLVAYPDNWRAAVRRPATLPHYPMVLHRGGYPDGS